VHLALPARLAAHTIHSVCEAMVGMGDCQFLARSLGIDILDIANSTFKSPHVDLNSVIFRCQQQSVLSFNIVQIRDSILVANHVEVGILYI